MIVVYRTVEKFQGEIITIQFDRPLAAIRQGIAESDTASERAAIEIDEGIMAEDDLAALVNHPEEFYVTEIDGTMSLVRRE